MTEYRASFDAAISFSNGGDLSVHGFRVDVPGPGVGEAEIAVLFVASLGLLMTDTAELSNVEIFAEPHKGTRGGPSDRADGLSAGAGRFVELGGAGTCLDVPFGVVSLAATVDLPAVVVRVTGTQQRGIDVGTLAAHDVKGKAVLVQTGDDAWSAGSAAAERHFLTRTGGEWLAEHGAALVGIDGAGLDDGPSAATQLAAAGIPVVKLLTGLDQLPPTGARFSAVPLRVEGHGSIPVRAFGRLAD
jgi:arylformamidase